MWNKIKSAQERKNFYVLESSGEYDGRLYPEYSDRTRRCSD